jgi:hypothetical protein
VTGNNFIVDAIKKGYTKQESISNSQEIWKWFAATTKPRIMPCKLIHLRKYILSLNNFW